MTEDELMRYCVELSRRKMVEVGAAPFAALIVKDGEIVAEGWNTVEIDHDPTLHGEVAAIRNACKKLKTFDLSGYDLYTSCEPCQMCVATMWWARIDRLFYANDLAATADIIPLDELTHEVTHDIHDRVMPAKQLLADEARAIIVEWVESGRATALMDRPE
jgi:tRNA(Arg) A34 adenosine deaminase TadA